MNKSFLKWAGGKSKSLEFIKCNILDNYSYGDNINGCFIEPFVGSGVVFLNVISKNYIINDINTDLCSLYTLLKRDGHKFVEECSAFFNNSKHTEDEFYEYRTKFNAIDEYDTERAQLFIYLNRHCFNGLCRYNKSGGFNVPYGRYKKVYFPEKELLYAIDKLKNVTILNIDFERVCCLSKPEDVIYSDPPYVPLSTTASFTDYDKTGFGIEKQKQLAKKAEESNCLFLISNHDNEITRELYRNADKIVTKEVNRFISADKNSRKPVRELLAIYKKG